MHFYFVISLLLTGSLSCQSQQTTEKVYTESPDHIKTVRHIPLPNGYIHVKGSDSSFAQWLLEKEIKTDRTVYLYNGLRKQNQDAQFAVLNIPIGKKDLLQCADVAMKLRGDYLFETSAYGSIKYLATSGVYFDYNDWRKGTRWKQSGSQLSKYTTHTDESPQGFARFMDLVYNYCGTWSLSKQLNPVSDLSKIQPGDVFVQGGFPGHAVIVLAVAKNKEQKTIFLLAQGFMPAQDIHILNNLTNSDLNPWYSVEDMGQLKTPEWTFEKRDLKTW